MIIKILCIIFGAVAVFAVASTIANKQNVKNLTEYISTLDKVAIEEKLPVEIDSEGYYTITTDRDLKVLQLTDIHIGGGWTTKKMDTRAINAVASMVIAEKPDIVIATGDISYPVPVQAVTFNNQYASTVFATLMEHLGVYWTVTFGNHDSEMYSIYNREEMADFYADEKWTNCLFLKGDENVDGKCNSVIKVKNSDGIITQALITIDTNDYPKDTLLGGLIAGPAGHYDNIHENQTEWYKTACENLNAENKAFIKKNFEGDEKKELLNNFSLVKSLVFMHIPPVEYKEAWDEFKANGYKDSENVKYYYGTLGEAVCHPAEDDQFFEAALEMKSTQGMFVGHDHINGFSLEYKGIRLTYGMSIDYIAYGSLHKKGSQRGCTVITVKPDGTFDCYSENYYQDKYINPDKEEITMQVLNEEFN